MIFNKDTAYQIAELLLKIKAIKLNLKNPYTWASGIISPIYCDNRVTLSYPRVRTFIRQEFVKAIQEVYGTIDLIAGVATGGIPQGVLIAQELDVPFAYVRSTKKGHGMENKIEGSVEEGQNVVVVEDLISTGNSSLRAVTALRETGCNVKGMVAIFTYKLHIAEANFKKHKCELVALTDYHYLIQKAVESDYIEESDLNTLLKWREDPENWGK